jgi:ABC-2 type transport system ATP-binding protein
MSPTGQHLKAPRVPPGAAGAATLVVEDLRKAYGATVALDGVDLTVEAGTILGLLGPNGAGKTTLVSIVAGIRRADTGTVSVAGIDVAREADRAHRLIGYAPQDTGVYPTLTVRENLRFFAGLAALRGSEQRDRIDAVGAALGLTALFDRRGSQISGGERRRLHTAIALVHRPQLVLLDEPTTGADVRTRGEILALVRSLAESGSAVVYSTHYLHEIEELAATVAFIDHGRIVASGSLSDLVERFGSSALVLRFDGPVPAAARVDGAVVDGLSVRVPTPDPAGTAARLLPQLGPDTAGLLAIEVVRPSLESVFLTVTGRHYEAAVSEPAA